MFPRVKFFRVFFYRTVPLGMEKYNPVIFLDLQNGKAIDLTLFGWFKMYVASHLLWKGEEFCNVW